MSPPRPARYLLATLAALLTAGCRWVAPGAATAFAPVPAGRQVTVGACAAACTDSVDIIAMGVGGYLIVPWRDTTHLVMTPPAFTNPSLWHIVALDWLIGTHPDTARIERRLRHLPGVDSGRLARVDAVLIGHAHYDHLMDVPPLVPHLPRARVLGSSTAVNLLSPVAALGSDSTRPSPSRLQAIDTIAGHDAAHPGQSLTLAAHLRVRPIVWAHAPNFGNFTFATGNVTTPRTSLPRHITGWRMGQPYAWVVDLLDDSGAVAIRVFSHDAAAPRDVILRAVSVIATMPPARSTVAILTAANHDQANGYPQVLLATLEPQHVILGHWEDFFSSPDRPPRIVRGIRGEELIPIVEQFQGPRWTVLEPGARIRVRSP